MKNRTCHPNDASDTEGPTDTRNTTALNSSIGHDLYFIKNLKNHIYHQPPPHQT